jgi:hypothetical protein
MLQDEKPIGASERDIVRSRAVIGAGYHECVSFVAVGSLQKVANCSEVIGIELVQ